MKLGVAGKSVWRALVADYDFDSRELAILERACRQLDDVAMLERLLARDGPIVEGSMGQPRLSPIVGELRLGRLAAAKLLGDLVLPDEDAKPMTARSERARRAANSRWTRVTRLQEKRGAALA